MRFGWSLHAGPFWLSDTLWRSKRRSGPRHPVWHGQLADGWRCPHDHRRKDTAEACAAREARRRLAMTKG